MNLFLRQFLPILFSGLSTRQKKIKNIQAGWMKTKLRVACERLVNLKSLWQEMAVLKPEKILSTSKLRSLIFLTWLKYLVRVTFCNESYNSSVIVTANFWRKVSTALELSFSVCFQNVESFILSSSDHELDWLHYLISVRICILYYVYRCQSRVFTFLENTKFLHNRSILLSLKTCYQVITFVEYFKVALYVESKQWL